MQRTKISMKNTYVLITALSLLMISGGRAAGKASFVEPGKKVYEHYLKIESDLSNDSFKGVNEDASAIAKAVRGDEMKRLPAGIAKQADALAAARNIKAAREAFKPLSASLIKYLADNKMKGEY